MHRFPILHQIKLTLGKYVTEQVNLLLEMLTSHVGVLVWGLDVLFFILFPANASWEAVSDGPVFKFLPSKWET